jgi:hypothetical protein
MELESAGQPVGRDEWVISRKCLRKGPVWRVLARQALIPNLVKKKM